MLKYTLIVILSIICIVAVYVYISNQLPPDVEPKGNETTVAWISLGTAVLSFFGTVLTFILKIIELKTKKKKIKSN